MSYRFVVECRDWTTAIQFALEEAEDMPGARFRVFKQPKHPNGLVWRVESIPPRGAVSDKSQQG